MTIQHLHRSGRISYAGCCASFKSNRDLQIFLTLKLFSAEIPPYFPSCSPKRQLYLQETGYPWNYHHCWIGKNKSEFLSVQVDLMHAKIFWGLLVIGNKNHGELMGCIQQLGEKGLERPDPSTFLLKRGILSLFLPFSTGLGGIQGHLTGLGLPDFLASLNSGCDRIDDRFNFCSSPFNSARMQRAAGYFCSLWLMSISVGMLSTGTVLLRLNVAKRIYSISPG